MFIFRNSLWRRPVCTHSGCRAIARISISALTICRSHSGNSGYLCFLCPSCGKGVNAPIDSIEIWKLGREIADIRIISWSDDPEFREHREHPLAFVLFSDDEVLELSLALLSEREQSGMLESYAIDLRNAYPQIRLT